jgi:cytochrome c556
MRIVLMVAVASCGMLAACGGPETSQANNAQANIANSAAPPATAQATVATPGMSAVSGDQAKTIMHERHEGMEKIGKATKAIKRELDGASPNMAVVRAAAAEIADLSRDASGWFHAGTGPEVGKTGAKPEIWQNQQDFAAKLQAFQSAAAAFNTAAMSGDVGAAKAGFGDLGKSCKACHDKYRTEMKH